MVSTSFLRKQMIVPRHALLEIIYALRGRVAPKVPYSATFNQLSPAERSVMKAYFWHESQSDIDLTTALVD